MRCFGNRHPCMGDTERWRPEATSLFNHSNVLYLSAMSVEGRSFVTDLANADVIYECLSKFQLLV